MLTLPIKKKWLDMIVSGEKKEEYREITPYYTARFHNRESDEENINECILRNGYSKDSPSIGIDFWLDIGKGREDWGAEKGKVYYILVIKRVWKTKET